MCAQPILILEHNYTETTPSVNFRSKILSLSTTTLFGCDTSYTMTKSWSITPAISLTSNPSASSSQLVIPANTLLYGLYQFTYIVSVVLSNGTLLSNTASTFSRIVPTGFVVFALPNGIFSIRIGSQQTLILDPGVHSKDPDNYVEPKLLNYTFYCTTLNLSSTDPNIQINTDLLTYKQNSQLIMESNSTCFSFNCKLKQLILF